MKKYFKVNQEKIKELIGNWNDWDLGIGIFFYYLLSSEFYYK